MAAVEEGYTFAAVAAILGVAESKLRYWAQTGFVGPSQRVGARQTYSFRDLVGVKAAKELVDRGFSPAQIRRALEAVRGTLPDLDRPLDRLRVAFDGQALVVVDEGVAFEPTGQRVFDFGLAELAVHAQALDATPIAGRDDEPARPRPAAPSSGYDFFLDGLRLEAEGRSDEAAISYRKAIKLDAGLAAAHTNLGAIAFAQGELLPAREAFEAALALDPDQPEARYNLASVLIEAGDLDLAVSELRRVLQLAPTFADAHYNLASALERLGGKRQAREHFERYVALVGDGENDGPWVAEARARIQKLSGT